MLTLVDAQKNVLIRNGSRSETKSFVQGYLLDSLFSRRQPFITTEVAITTALDSGLDRRAPLRVLGRGEVTDQVEAQQVGQDRQRRGDEYLRHHRGAKSILPRKDAVIPALERNTGAKEGRASALSNFADFTVGLFANASCSASSNEAGIAEPTGSGITRSPGK